MSRSTLDIRLPKNFSKKLKQAGVEVMELFPDLVLCCAKCEVLWIPKMTRSGQLARDYWKCPCGCKEPRQE